MGRKSPLHMSAQHVLTGLTVSRGGKGDQAMDARFSQLTWSLRLEQAGLRVCLLQSQAPLCAVRVTSLELSLSPCCFLNL